MNIDEREVTSEIKLNALAQSIYNETQELGFNSGDYVKLMNQLLDMTISINGKKSKPKIDEGINYKVDKLPIETGDLLIREYDNAKDEKYVKKWLKDESNKLFLLSTNSRNKLSLDDFITDDKNIFATITLKNKTPIGLLALLNIDKMNRKAEMRKMIGELSERGKGYAREASEIWLQYATKSFNINKIYIDTVETNVKNIGLNRRLGFKIEGLLKRECIINEKEYDVLRMSYLVR